MDYGMIAVFAFCAAFGVVFTVLMARYHRRNEIKRQEQQIRVAKVHRKQQKEEAQRLKEAHTVLIRQSFREELQKVAKRIHLTANNTSYNSFMTISCIVA